MAQGEDEFGDEHGGSARDRAAILARRRRFIALAITGLATTACKAAPQPCLSVPEGEGVEISEGEGEEEADSNGPFVEDEGQPVESTDPEGEGVSGEEPPETGPRPEVCLNIAPVPQPQPCLKKAAPQPCLDMPAPRVKNKPKKSQPHPCLLMMIDVD